MSVCQCYSKCGNVYFSGLGLVPVPVSLMSFSTTHLPSKLRLHQELLADLITFSWPQRTL